MKTLVFNTSIETSLEQILLMIKDYMQGLVYDYIYVKANGKIRFKLKRKGESYSLFKCLITPDAITRRYIK